MFRKSFPFFLISLLISTFVFSQNKYPTGYFIPPLDIDLKLAGTFGELRSNHFHSGIDIRTGEVEGLEVHAIADGYVSRIKISSGGYGNALYITHPNGFVSVYGHLQKFNKALQSYTRKAQYQRESFSVDLFPDKNELKVGKGEIIARSGNSGSSSGPHLHFEIREEASQKPVNPLLFGIHVKDINRPIINLIKIYPNDPNTFINGKNKAMGIFVKRSGNSYILNKKDTIRISGKAFFGLNTFDPFNGGHNKNGVFSVQLLVDKNEIYSHDLEKFSFAETRYINSLIDYKEYKQKKRRVQKSYIQPNNRLSIYKNVKNRGIVSFTDDTTHQITYIVKDVKGNEAKLSFYVKSEPPKSNPLKNDPKDSKGELFNYTGMNTFKSDKIKLEIPGKALYDTIYFQYKVLPKAQNALTPLYQIHFDYVPLQVPGSLAIETDSLKAGLQGKALIVKIEENGKPSPAGGAWDKGYIKTNIRQFGNYCVMLDTVAPTISPLNIKNGKNLANQNTIRVRIKDSFSGIKSYRGTLNGKWILMEYDSKRSLLTYRFDDKLLAGKNTFKITVSDERGNTATYTTNLIK
ncbi:MAG: M23 family metallopeptidase [Chlorobi bacterium]|nr:M23 family metallopeptidase [Chlorobiota bacterium]